MKDQRWERRAVRSGCWLLCVVVLVAILASPGTVDAQCAMCKEVVANADDDSQVAKVSRGFYYSILSMIGVPLVLAGGLISAIAVNSRSRNRDESTSLP